MLGQSLGAAVGGASVRIGPTPVINIGLGGESVSINPDYSNRPGYDTGFLGFEVPFPTLTNVTRPKAFAQPGVAGDTKFELKYYHYSVIFNKARKLAFVAGVNLDMTALFHATRETDRWSYDPRVAPKEELQAGEDLYKANPLDRGHLVRRADAGWGHTEEEAKLANDDTIHFTNCSPQHAITNQGKEKIVDRGRVIVAPPGLKLWGKLETHIAKQGKDCGRKISVFNGPIFRTTYQLYRGVQIPKEFWKMVVFADAGVPAHAGGANRRLGGGIRGRRVQVGEAQDSRSGNEDEARLRPDPRVRSAGAGGRPREFHGGFGHGGAGLGGGYGTVRRLDSRLHAPSEQATAKRSTIRPPKNSLRQFELQLVLLAFDHG